jgi:hypothetical protein
MRNVPTSIIASAAKSGTNHPARVLCRFSTSCAAWETRHNARRIFALPNGSVVFIGFGSRSEERARQTLERSHGWRFPRGRAGRAL